MTYKDFFWAHEYRHYMRDLKAPIKRAIFKAFIEWELDPAGVSELHRTLIREYTGHYIIEGESLQDRQQRLNNNYLWQ
jgi:hypothetical protein